MADERILILDDEETIRFVLRTVITGTGHEVVQASTVKEAISLIAGEHFAAAMLDLALPDGSGVRVMEAIKQASPDTEVIIMTGHASVDTAVDAIRLGAYDYVHKPFDIDTVSATLKRALEKRELTRSNRRLVAELETHNRELAAMVKRLASLNAAGSGMSGILELKGLLDFFLRLVARELDVDRASIMLLENGELRIAASVGIDDEIVKATKVAPGEGVAGRVVETGEPILVDDVSTEAAMQGTARQHLSNSFISAPITMSVPIKSNSVLGAINVTNRKSGEPFTKDDLAYLAGLAGQAAVAIERARHLEGLQEAVGSLTAARQELQFANRQLQEANAQLEEASRLKSEFLANTSHELRTPLNGILGFLQLVLDGMYDTPEEEREFLTKAMECSRHLLSLINDVLDIAKIEAGKLALEIGAVDVVKLFEEVHTLTHVQASQKGIELSFEVEESSDQPVRGDFGKLKQVLVNLVGNSLKFTERGSITVRAGARPEIGHFKFEVVDTGTGIPADRQNIIFDKFTQADGSTTRRFGGSGLGLAICRSLVELMGGIIGVESGGEGKGTRMYFSLPIWQPDVDAGALGDLEEIEGPDGAPLVLVVEDDPVFRRFVGALLNRNGYRTVMAAEAEQGWVALRRLRPAIVVLDYALTASEGAGIRTGWDLAQRMASEPETRRVPLIFVSGFDEELRKRMMNTVFSRRPEHLTKPVEGNVLIERIESMIGPGVQSPIRILLADDDPSVGIQLKKILPKDRFRLEITADGEECLHALRTRPRGFDLLLLDLMMPKVSGYDVLREMTLAGVASELPVLVLTSCPEPRNEEERRLLEGGQVVSVISKPQIHANHVLLPEVISRYLDGRMLTESGTAETDGEDRAEAA